MALLTLIVWEIRCNVYIFYYRSMDETSFSFGRRQSHINAGIAMVCVCNFSVSCCSSSCFLPQGILTILSSTKKKNSSRSSSLFHYLLPYFTFHNHLFSYKNGRKSLIQFPHLNMERKLDFIKPTSLPRL
jgi:hypothetical protein